MVSRRRVAASYLLPVFVIFLLVVGGLFIAAFMLAPSDPETPGACTLEAKLCPDGSSVGRVAPRCDFAPCPTDSTNVNQGTPDNANRRRAPANTNTAPPGTQVAVTLIDTANGLPITDTAVRLTVDNGTRCVTDPCPTNGRDWDGMTDGRGVVAIPAAYVDESMVIFVAGYQAADLRISGRQTVPGEWTLRLDPES